MPDLCMPVFNQEPVTSLIGNMVFPNDPGKAMTVAAWFLDGAILAASNEDISRVPAELIWSIRDQARRYPSLKAEVDEACYRGTQAGALGSYLWHAEKTATKASIEDAIRACEKLAGQNFSGVRSTFYKAKSDFSRVLHFWSILAIECGNKWPKDFRLFVSSAEAFLNEMRRLKIGGNSFVNPKYHAPVDSWDWRIPGTIPVGTIAAPFLPISKKRAGRPRRIAVQG